MNRKIQTLCWGLGFAFTLAAMASTFASQGSSETKSEPVRFKRAAWKTGDTIDSKMSVDGSLTVSMEVKGELVQGFDQNTRERMHKHNVVLAVDDDGRSKMSVHYDEVVEIQNSTGIEEPDVKVTSPIAGETFVLERNAKGVSVTDEDGTVVREELAQLVREKELSRDGSLEQGFDRLAHVVSESARKIGERIRVPDEVVLELSGADEELSVSHFRLELRELRDVDGSSCAVFLTEIKLEGRAEGDEYRTTVELDGEVLIQIDGARFVSAELTGRMTLDGAVSTEETVVTISGEGPLKIVASAAYGRQRS